MSTQGSLVNPETLVHDGLIGDAPVSRGGQPEVAIGLASFLLLAAVAGIAQVTFNGRHLVLLVLEKSARLIRAGTRNQFVEIL